MHKLISNKNQINIVIHNEQPKRKVSQRNHRKNDEIRSVSSMVGYTQPFSNSSNLNTENQHLTNQLLNKQIENGDNNQFVNTYGKKLQLLENSMNDNKLRTDNIHENGQRIFNDVYNRFNDYSDTFKKHGSSHPYGTYDDDISIEDLYTNPMHEKEQNNLTPVIQSGRPSHNDENKFVESSLEPIQQIAKGKKYYLSTMNLSQLRQEYQNGGGTDDVSNINRKQQLISKIKELKSKPKTKHIRIKKKIST